nr:MAG TPA: hypothetical protein [Caudoviricetes sp.]DAY02416.1 MAG TPA: hypothetical protein [Caudoviricetes sp.]
MYKYTSTPIREPSLILLKLTLTVYSIHYFY